MVFSATPVKLSDSGRECKRRSPICHTVGDELASPVKPKRSISRRAHSRSSSMTYNLRPISICWAIGSLSCGIISSVNRESAISFLPFLHAPVDLPELTLCPKSSQRDGGQPQTTHQRSVVRGWSCLHFKPCHTSTISCTGLSMSELAVVTSARTRCSSTFVHTSGLRMWSLSAVTIVTTFSFISFSSDCLPSA